MSQPGHRVCPDPHPIVAAVRDFVEREVRPHASALEHADRYPHDMVAAMRALGLFGALVPERWGGLGLDVTTYARVIEELCRGWMSLAGVINSHTMAALIVLNHGTDEQRDRLLPRFARGEARGGLCLTEPHAGSDVQAIRTVARRDGDAYVLSGSKMFVTNGREGNTFALLARTDTGANPPHRGMSCFIVEKGGPGLEVVKSIGKLGYKGVDTAELLFDGHRVPAVNLVGGVEGRGFKHVMAGLETGRVNIAARAVGVAQAALDEAVRHLRGRVEVSEPATAAGVAARLALADMAARVAGARLVTYWAASMKDAGRRCDLEAGMAKLYASEAAQAAAVEALGLIGPDGCAPHGEVERHYRDTPLMIIGEGTNEIQRLVICRNLLERYGERTGVLRSVDGEPEERRQMVLAVRQMVEREVAPAAADVDRADRFPGELLERLAGLGLLGATIPADHGGLGLDPLTGALIVEEIGRGSAAVAEILASHLALARLVADAGTDQQRKRLLPGLATGARLGTIARPSPGAGSRPVGRREGGALVLGGRDLTAVAAGRASDVAATAMIGGRSRVILLSPGDPGLVWAGAVGSVGLRGIDTRGLTLADCRVPADRMLGQAPDVVDAAVARARAQERTHAASAAVGLGQAALEAAIRYSQQRVAFGVPICQHQAIQLKLADMATRLTVARLLARHAAQETGAAAASAAAQAERLAARVAHEVTLEAMRIHGGYGYTTEFPVERYYRDAAPFLARVEADIDAALGVADHLLAAATP